GCGRRRGLGGDVGEDGEEQAPVHALVEADELLLALLERLPRVVERVVVRAEVVVAVAQERALAAARRYGGRGEQQRQPGEQTAPGGRGAAHAFRTRGCPRRRAGAATARIETVGVATATGQTWPERNAAGTTGDDTELPGRRGGTSCGHAGGHALRSASAHGVQACMPAHLHAPPTPTPPPPCSRAPCW